MVVPFCKRGSGGFWTLAFLSLVIVVAGVPLSRGGGEQNGDLDGGRESSGRGGADGGSVERSGPLRFRNAQNPMLNQENIMRHVEALGGGHLLRDIDTMGDERLQRPSRGFDSVVGSTFGGYKRLDPLIGTSFGGQKRSGGRLSNSITELLKRNFDEIDRSGFDSFVKRNNFDEIDRYGFDGFVRKRRSGGQMNADSSSDDEQRNEGMQSSQRGLDRN